ncbi:MAG: hypothetical protein MHM6MM_004166 [Cercozoa sp. M6MM]
MLQVYVAAAQRIEPEDGGSFWVKVDSEKACDVYDKSLCKQACLKCGAQVGSGALFSCEDNDGVVLDALRCANPVRDKEQCGSFDHLYAASRDPSSDNCGDVCRTSECWSGTNDHFACGVGTLDGCIVRPTKIASPGGLSGGAIAAIVFATLASIGCVIASAVVGRRWLKSRGRVRIGNDLDDEHFA